MWKVLGYDADAFGWVLVSKHDGYKDGLLAYRAVKAARVHQIVALVQVRYGVSDGQPEIELSESDAPNPQNLLTVAAFRDAALRTK